MRGHKTRLSDAFQSTLPCGSDEVLFLYRFCYHLRFQSTLPYGSDICMICWRWQNCHFNPRSLTGATEWSMPTLRLYVFQSTLPHGSDYKPPYLRRELRISIHAPLRERLEFRTIYGERYEKFQSTLPYGSDFRGCAAWKLAQVFQSTLPYGSDFLW